MSLILRRQVFSVINRTLNKSKEKSSLIEKESALKALSMHDITIIAISWGFKVVFIRLLPMLLPR
ncbi:hypothetical protein GCM10027361_25090 [Erwinia aphidicola]